MADDKKLSYESDFTLLFKSEGQEAILKELEAIDKEAQGVQKTIDNIGKGLSKPKSIKVDTSTAMRNLKKLQTLTERIQNSSKNTVKNNQVFDIAKQIKATGGYNDELNSMFENMSLKIDGVVHKGLDNMLAAYEKGGESIGKIKFNPPDVEHSAKEIESATKEYGNCITKLVKYNRDLQKAMETNADPISISDIKVKADAAKKSMQELAKIIKDNNSLIDNGKKAINTYNGITRQLKAAKVGQEVTNTPKTEEQPAVTPVSQPTITKDQVKTWKELKTAADEAGKAAEDAGNKMQKALNGKTSNRDLSQYHVALDEGKKRLATNSSTFVDDKGGMLEKEANQFLKRFIDGFGDLGKYTDEQFAYITQRTKEYTALLKSEFDDIAYREGNNPSWVTAGPAKYDYGKFEKKLQAQMNATEKYDEKRQRFIENTERQLKQMIPAEEQIAYWKTGKFKYGEKIDDSDPLIKEKYEAKLLYLKEQQELMKNANQYFRKNKTMVGFEGFSEEQNRTLDTALQKKISEYSERNPDWAKTVKPFESFQLTNNNATIKATEQMVQKISKRLESSVDSAVTEFNGGKLIRNKQVNRLQIDFDEKPDSDMIGKLKGEAWKWSPKNGVWQRQLTENAERSAKRILGNLLSTENNVSQIKTETSNQSEEASRISAELRNKFINNANNANEKTPAIESSNFIGDYIKERQAEQAKAKAAQEAAEAEKAETKAIETKAAAEKELIDIRRTAKVEYLGERKLEDGNVLNRTAAITYKEDDKKTEDAVQRIVSGWVKGTYDSYDGITYVPIEDKEEYKDFMEYWKQSKKELATTGILSSEIQQETQNIEDNTKKLQENAETAAKSAEVRKKFIDNANKQNEALGPNYTEIAEDNPINKLIAEQKQKQLEATKNVAEIEEKKEQVQLRSLKDIQQEIEQTEQKNKNAQAWIDSLSPYLNEEHYKSSGKKDATERLKTANRVLINYRKNPKDTVYTSLAQERYELNAAMAYKEAERVGVASSVLRRERTDAIDSYIFEANKKAIAKELDYRQASLKSGNARLVELQQELENARKAEVEAAQKAQKLSEGRLAKEIEITNHQDAQVQKESRNIEKAIADSSKGKLLTETKGKQNNESDSNNVVKKFIEQFNLSKNTSKEIDKLFTEIRVAYENSDFDEYNKALSNLFNVVQETSKSIKIENQDVERAIQHIEAYASRNKDPNLGHAVHVDKTTWSELSDKYGRYGAQSILSSLFGVGNRSTKQGVGKVGIDVIAGDWAQNNLKDFKGNGIVEAIEYLYNILKNPVDTTTVIDSVGNLDKAKHVVEDVIIDLLQLNNLNFGVSEWEDILGIDEQKNSKRKISGYKTLLKNTKYKKRNEPIEGQVNWFDDFVDITPIQKTLQIEENVSQEIKKQEQISQQSLAEEISSAQEILGIEKQITAEKEKQRQVDVEPMKYSERLKEILTNNNGSPNSEALELLTNDALRVLTTSKNNKTPAIDFSGITGTEDFESRIMNFVDGFFDGSDFRLKSIDTRGGRSIVTLIDEKLQRVLTQRYELVPDMMAEIEDEADRPFVYQNTDNRYYHDIEKYNKMLTKVSAEKKRLMASVESLAVEATDYGVSLGSIYDDIESMVTEADIILQKAAVDAIKFKISGAKKKIQSTNSLNKKNQRFETLSTIDDFIEGAKLEVKKNVSDKGYKQNLGKIISTMVAASIKAKNENLTYDDRLAAYNDLVTAQTKYKSKYSTALKNERYSKNKTSDNSESDIRELELLNQKIEKAQLHIKNLKSDLESFREVKGFDELSKSVAKMDQHLIDAKNHSDDIKAATHDLKLYNAEHGKYGELLKPIKNELTKKEIDINLDRDIKNAQTLAEQYKDIINKNFKGIVPEEDINRTCEIIDKLTSTLKSAAEATDVSTKKNLFEQYKKSDLFEYNNSIKELIQKKRDIESNDKNSDTFKKYQSDIKVAEERLIGFEKQLQSLGNIEGAEKVTEAVEKMRNTLANAQKEGATLKEIGSALKEFNQGKSEFTATYKNVNGDKKELDKAKTQNDADFKELQKLNIEIDGANSRLKKLEDQMNSLGNTPGVKKVREAFENLKKSIEEGIDPTATLEKKRKAASDIKNYEKSFKDEYNATNYIKTQNDAINENLKAEAAKSKSNSINQIYNDLLNTINKINNIDSEISKYKGKDNGTGIIDSYVENLRNKKQDLVNEFYNVSETISNFFKNNEFKKGNEIEIPILEKDSQITKFFLDTGVQAEISSQKIQKFTDALNKVSTVKMNAENEFKEQLINYANTDQRLSKIKGIDMSIMSESKNELDGWSLSDIKSFLDDVKSKKNKISYDTSEYDYIQKLINLYIQYGNQLADTAEMQERYLNSKKMFSNNDIQTEELNKQIEAQKKLENIAKQRAKEKYDTEQLYIKGFSQNKLGISTLDYSVWDAEKNKLVELRTEMGSVIKEAVTTETAVNQSIKHMQSGQKITESSASMLSVLSGAGVNVNPDNAAAPIQRMIEKTNELKKALNNGSEDDVIVRLSRESKDAIKEVDKLYNQMQKRRNEIAENPDKIKNLGKADVSKSLESQLKSAITNDVATKFSNASVSFGKFNAATGKITYTVKSLNGEIRQCEAEVNRLDGSMSHQENTVKNTNQSMSKSISIYERFKASIGSIGKQMLAATVGYNVFYKALGMLRNGIGYVKEIDLAMTELKKVTDGTASTYDKFLNNAYSSAGKVGATVSEFTVATSNFARLGYSINESSNMAQTAVVYKNVADGLNDIETATSSIVSTMKAFNVEADDTMSIADKFNEIGNNYAITSAGIGDALTRSASALAAAGNTLDESIALITGANSVVDRRAT